jgi:protein-S-isoprenylcysteine O-methyltransferase Ste14
MTISPFFKAISALLVLLQFSSIGILLLQEPIFGSSIFLFFQLTGVVIGLMGVFTLQLGKFNIIPIPKENCCLHTNGIYHYIRHPMYASIFLFFIPIILQSTNLISFISFAILSITLFMKLHFEEYLLEQKFAEYATYKCKSKKLIPFIF